MNKQSHFPYTGTPVYFDGLSTGPLSLAIITRHLVHHLRQDLAVPAFALSYDKQDSEFYLGRHLTGQPPVPSLIDCPRYIYVDSGMTSHQILGLTAAQSLAITAIDDFRWKFQHVQHQWKSVDSLVTFSRFSQRLLEKFLKRKVDYFPLGVSTHEFHPLPIKPAPPEIKTFFRNFTVPIHTLKNQYTFLNVGFIQKRKGISNLLSAYYKAFYNNPSVLLWIHGPKGPWSEESCRDLLGLFNTAHAPLIIWTDEILTTSRLNQLYNFADCYVSPHHLEGFGLGPLQALACGLPVIASAFAGPMDYLTDKVATLIPTQEDYINLPKLGKVPWGKYKEDDLVSALAKFPNKTFHKDLVTHWSWKRSAEMFKRLLHNPGKIETSLCPGVTICIPCRNAPQDLARCLGSLFSTPAGISYKVLVANDGNSPEVSRVCNQYKLRVKELTIPTSFWINYARNVLISNVSTEHLVFLDCDTEITTPHWLSIWKTAHVKYKATASSILQFYPDGKVNFAGNNNPGNPCTQYQKEPTVECYLPRETSFTQTSAAMFNTRILHRFGFWEGYTLYFDEADLCAYLWKHQLKSMYLPVTSIIHHSGSLRRSTKEQDPNNGEAIYNSFWRRVS